MRARRAQALTFMNESGRSVGEAMRFYNLAPADVVVLHDELDLPPGKVRVKTGGGHAGHNGLRSIQAHIGPEFHRVRLGIGHPGNKDLVHSYVLHDFAKADREWLEPLLDGIADAAENLARREFASFQNKVHLALNPEPEKPPRRPGGGAAESVLMGFRCGIVGLPNVGKSTLFNALIRTAAAQASNYPFTTITPNVGEVAVPDPRLEALARISKSPAVVPTRISSSISPGWCAAPRRARGWATASSPTSARSTPSSMWCAASRTPTSPMSRAGSIRSATSRRSRPS
jgi:hypothetical protein